MPELPDAETVRRRAEHDVRDGAVVRVACDDPPVLRTTSQQGRGRALTGATVTAVDSPDPR